MEQKASERPTIRFRILYFNFYSHYIKFYIYFLVKFLTFGFILKKIRHRLSFPFRRDLIRMPESYTFNIRCLDRRLVFRNETRS
jgi:hypothetical protein